MSKLLSNLPVEDLTSENDYLGIIDKGEIIKTFLETNTEQFSEIKMFSLFGEWGSGKSTLMKYLEKELKGNFNTFFFEAWEFEKDDNLSISLLEYIMYESNTVEEEFFGDILKVGGKILRGLGNSVQFNVPLYPTGPSIKVDPSNFVKEFSKAESLSFYKALEKFKIDFRKWEDLKNEKKDKDFNIIFIDDLDRCEPQNVLNLLSALKLFFTYGEKTIFFCGVDKKAVNQAVKTKYGKVVKANEYLEKIFDISFTMPEHNDISKLVNQYFDDRELESINGKLNDNISAFFKAIKFTNPRRIKKVLNKFLLLKTIKSEMHNNHSYYKFIPNIILKNEGDFFETVLTLQTMILHEFYPELYIELFNLKYKESCLRKAINNSNTKGNSDSYFGLVNHYMALDLVNKKLDKIDFINSNTCDHLVFTFLPNNILELEKNNYSRTSFHTMKVSEINIEYRFLIFLLDNTSILSRSTSSSISLNQIKEGIKKIL